MPASLSASATPMSASLCTAAVWVLPSELRYSTLSYTSCRGGGGKQTWRQSMWVIQSHCFKMKKGNRWWKHPWRLHVSHLDGEAEDLDAHAAHVRCSHLSHQSGKFVSVLVNLLYSQGAWKRWIKELAPAWSHGLQLVFYNQGDLCYFMGF